MKKYLDFIINRPKKVYGSLLFTFLLTVSNTIVTFYIENSKEDIGYVCIIILLILVLVASFIISSFIIFYLGKRKYKKDFGKCTVVIKRGNIFDKRKNVINIIPIDDDYTNVVDDIKIAYSSLHGQLLQHLNNKELFIRSQNPAKKGNLIYDPYNSSIKYFVFPLAKLDENNKIILEKSEYCNRVYNMLDEIDAISNRILVRMPLIGDGNARIIDLPESIQKLEMILFLIKLYDFKKKTEIEIILYEKDEKIDLTVL